MISFRLATLGLAALLAFAAPAIAEEQKPAARSITVSGHGEVRSKPDLAVIAIGVLKQAATARQALDLNNKAMADILAALTAAGVEARDVQTSGFFVSARLDYSRSSTGVGEAVGFDASNNVSVIVRKLADLGQVLDAAVTSGANQINGVTFRIAAPELRQDEARKLAFSDAERKAKLFAGAANSTLGPVLSLSEGGGFSPPGPMARMTMESAGAAVPVAEGELAVAVDVTVTWEMK